MDADELNELKEARQRDINKLMECDGFTGYFSDRLRDRQKELETSVLEDDSLTPEQREIMRRMATEYRTYTRKIVTTDHAMAKRQG